MAAGNDSSWSLTSYLLSLHEDQFTRATQSPFLKRAAEGSLSKSVTSHWLANDRLYMRGYIRLTGELLRILELPEKPVPTNSQDPIELRLLDWLVDALVNIRREERFFLDVAERYDINVDISDSEGIVPNERKIEGLKKFESLFASLTAGESPNDVLPWLEGVVAFWATEKVYFTAWSWAKEQAAESSAKEAESDADGGAMRKEFIPNWTNEEFIKFVDTLEKILNDGAKAAIANEKTRKQVEDRAAQVWAQLLDAEEHFWPKL
jgi:thiaminase